MSRLGQILEPPAEGPRGRDLQAEVTLGRGQLGRPVSVRVPLELPVEGGRVARALDPEGAGDGQLSLNLPGDLPDGAVVRLRGQGEALEDGAPGDLYLTVRVSAAAPPSVPVGGWLWAALLAAAAVAGWLLTR